MRFLPPWIILLSCALTCFPVSAVSPADSEVQFNRDIRPILSDKCFHCHGPDSARREAGLRLDVRADALKDGAIVPGSPDESEILRRILSTDPDEQMPPPESKLLKISSDEVKTLQKWVAQGATYQAHWSFIPLQPISVPSQTVAPAGDTATSPLDLMVRARLQDKGWPAQPEADRAALIRRVTLDLTGLPPSADAVQAFIADASPAAYEKLVDRLLASPAYGERMAVDWLDVSRYADSYGFQVDREREAWPWRDWVIRSFNDNLPFDQFITWQLAGDLLPNATDDQILATAFNRLHQQESEGGSVEEEYRVEYVADRVQTFSTAFLGLTLECARCHDHKFDPITQKEYYQLSAYFQNIDEAGLYSYFTNTQPTPSLPLMSSGQKDTRNKLRVKVSQLEAELNQWTASPDAISEWLQRQPHPLQLNDELGHFTFDSLKENKSPNSLNPQQTAVFKGENSLTEGREGKAILFTGDDAVDLPFGNFNAYEPFTISFWLRTPDVKERAVVLHRSRAWMDAASRGYEVLIEEGKLKWSLIHFWPGDAVSIRARDSLSLNEWTHVTVSNDGSSRAAGLKIYVNGKLAQVDVIRDHLTKDITGGGGDNIALGERFRDRGFKGGALDDLRIFESELSALEVLSIWNKTAPAEILSKSPSAFTIEDRTLLQNHVAQSHLTPALIAKRKELKEAREALTKFSDGLQEVMVMKELPEPKKAYVLLRGEYNQRRDEVVSGTPASLSPWPEKAPNNRLGLAQWLTDPRHPLTARVIVNRFWQSIFGRGLVKTSEDFGSQGSRPEYANVLDWLAQRYIASGWDTKAIIKTMVMSQTYRQRSMADTTIMADDPENEWLARGPRFRLPAEVIRDNALASAGLLDQRAGGPPVNPYEMSEAFKPAKLSAGSANYRRSLYTNWCRTSPPPAMVAFDAPRRAVCIAKRERTDSPLQALILLNGTQFVEAARVLGETLHRQGRGDPARMIEAGFLRCLSRMPDEREKAICLQLYQEQLQYFTAHPDEATGWLNVGQIPRNPNISLPQTAASAVLAQALLNHDACVLKR